MSTTFNNNIDELSKIREKFFNFLLKKPCTSGGAVEYLSRNGVPENFFDLLLTEAANMKLIDDAAYAKLFIDGHLTWGNAKIIYELSSRGVSHEEINEALDECEDESFRASELAQSWRKVGIDERKIINRLLSRGFSHRSARASSVDKNN